MVKFIMTVHGNYAFFTDEIFLWYSVLTRLIFCLLEIGLRYSFMFSIIRSINIILTTKDINNNLAKFVVNALLVKRLRLLLNRNWLVPNILNDKNIKYLTRNLFIISTQNMIIYWILQKGRFSLLVKVQTNLFKFCKLLYK